MNAYTLFFAINALYITFWASAPWLNAAAMTYKDEVKNVKR